MDLVTWTFLTSTSCTHRRETVQASSLRASHHLARPCLASELPCEESCKMSCSNGHPFPSSIPIIHSHHPFPSFIPIIHSYHPFTSSIPIIHFHHPFPSSI